MNCLLASRRWLGWGAVVSTLGCAKLPAVPAGECGNGIKEGIEECDTYAPEGAKCRAPGEVGACRYDCSVADGGTPKCPDGSACGLDGICRFSQKRGSTTVRQYEAWGQFVPLPAQSLRLGDFDGDGRQDLLALGHANLDWQSLPRILFFDETGAPGDVFDPQTPIASPAIVKLGPAGDPRDQIVFSTTAGIGTLESNSERVVLPIAYPFQVLPAGWSYRVSRVRGPASAPVHEGVVVFWGQPAGIDTPASTLLIVPEVGKGGSIPAPLTELAGGPLAVNVNVRPDSPCDEAVLGFQGSGVYLVDMCDADGKWLLSLEPRIVASLPEGHTLGQGLIAAQINPEDTYLDLVLGDENGKPYVAFGRGDGTFVANPKDPEATLGLAWPAIVSTCAASSTPVDQSYPLAVGDLNQDGVADWVSPSGVVLAQSVVVNAEKRQVEVQGCAANGPFVGKWSQAMITELNRDGFPDVIAGSSTEPDLDVLLGTGRDRMNRFGVVTDGPVTDMLMGDFNGDLLPDIALAEQQPAPGNGEKLAIAFGSASGVPGRPVDVAAFDSIEQLSVANYLGDDAIEEIGVVARSTGGSGEELSVFAGNPGGHPIAALGLAKLLPDAQLGYSGAPRASSVGVFEAGAPPSVLALAVDEGPAGDGCSRYRLWLVPGVGETKLGAPIPSACLAPELDRPQDSELSLYLFTGDVDRNGADEAFLMASLGGNVALYQVNLPTLGSVWEGEPLRRPSTASGSLVFTSVPKLIDLDGDGWRDLVFIQERDLGPELGVVWNDEGTLNLLGFQRIELGGGAARGFSAVVDDETMRFVAVTDGAVFEIATGAERSLARTLITDVPGGEAVELGELTGDGLLDFVVAVPGGVRILAEVPARR